MMKNYIAIITLITFGLFVSCTSGNYIPYKKNLVAVNKDLAIVCKIDELRLTTNLNEAKGFNCYIEVLNLKNNPVWFDELNLVLLYKNDTLNTDLIFLEGFNLGSTWLYTREIPADSLFFEDYYVSFGNRTIEVDSIKYLRLEYIDSLQFKRFGGR